MKKFYLRPHNPWDEDIKIEVKANNANEAFIKFKLMLGAENWFAICDENNRQIDGGWIEGNGFTLENNPTRPMSTSS